MFQRATSLNANQIRPPEKTIYRVSEGISSYIYICVCVRQTQMRVFIVIFVCLVLIFKKLEKRSKQKKDEEREREVPDPQESIEDTPTVYFPPSFIQIRLQGAEF